MTTLAKHHTKIPAASAPLISEFAALITQGLECWAKAGEVVVALIDEHGLTVPEIAGSSSCLTEAIVGRFESLGRKQIVPRLLVADYPAADHMIKLPYSEQARLQDGAVELLIITESGTETLQVAPENLTPAQCRQVFDRGAVRSLAAQRAFIESRNEADRAKGKVMSSLPVYSVRGRKVIINHPCELSARQLASILSEIQ